MLQPAAGRSGDWPSGSQVERCDWAPGFAGRAVRHFESGAGVGGGSGAPRSAAGLSCPSPRRRCGASTTPRVSPACRRLPCPRGERAACKTGGAGRGLLSSGSFFLLFHCTRLPLPGRGRGAARVDFRSVRSSVPGDGGVVTCSPVVGAGPAPPPSAPPRDPQALPGAASLLPPHNTAPLQFNV